MKINQKKFKPEIKYCENSKIFKYFKNFLFIDRKNNEAYIDYLTNNNLIIQKKDILISKLFFINFENNGIEDLYIGILDNDKNSIIYFYFNNTIYSFLNDNKYNLYFLIQFYDEKILNEEIEKNIKRKGLRKYLDEFGIQFSNIGEWDLINIDSKVIGKLYNYKQLFSYIFLSKPPKNINNKKVKSIEKSGFLIGILYCLLNIEPLTDFFSKIYKLLNLIDENSTIIILYYKILQDLLWNSDDNDESINKVYLEFIEKIKDISKINDINNNIDSLIKWLLIELHNNLLEDNKGKKIKDYRLPNNFSELPQQCDKSEKKAFIKKFDSMNNSIIKNLFFFKLELINNCDCTNSQINKNIFHFTYNSFLNIDSNKIDEVIKQNKREEIDIDDLMDYTFNKNVHICEECCKDIIVKRKFYSLPQYLIICLNKKKGFKIYL